MCGILGFVDKRRVYSTDEKRRIASAMLRVIKHRGPDGDGIIIHDNIAIGQARLSIVDLSTAGLQPMWNRDKTLAISVNGEIYSHPKLRDELEKKYSFQSHSDSESMLYAYAEKGEACLADCKGMFAASVLDIPRNRIFLAVDRFSIKPLYYLDTPDWFAWSSEIKALLELPHIQRELETDALGEHLLFRSIAGEKTLLRGILKALPSQSFTFDLARNTLEKRIYWTPTFSPTSLAEVREKLLTSVHEHMLSDVPIGVQLSGGIDSSLVSALVRREMNSAPLHSFSIGVAHNEWNEFPFSRIVAQELKTVHHELLFSEHDFCAALPVATYHYDEPINHTHTIPMMLLSEEAKRHVTVLMSGEGADEIFGGYRRYRDIVKNPDRLLMSNAFVPRESLALTAPSVVPDLYYRTSLIASALPMQQRLALYDLATYLPPLLLRQDKMGMKSGLENRVPFLDHELVIAALSLRDDDRITDMGSKIALKRIAEEFLPQEIVHRTKVGFSQPIADWLRNRDGLGAYVRLLEHPKSPRPYFKYDAIREIIDAHRRGEQHAELLWILISLEVWSRIFLDGVDVHAVIE